MLLFWNRWTAKRPPACVWARPFQPLQCTWTFQWLTAILLLLKAIHFSCLTRSLSSLTQLIQPSTDQFFPPFLATPLPLLHIPSHQSGSGSLPSAVPHLCAFPHAVPSSWNSSLPSCPYQNSLQFLALQLAFPSPYFKLSEVKEHVCLVSLGFSSTYHRAWYRLDA